MVVLGLPVVVVGTNVVVTPRNVVVVVMLVVLVVPFPVVLLALLPFCAFEYNINVKSIINFMVNIQMKLLLRQNILSGCELFDVV